MNFPKLQQAIQAKATPEELYRAYQDEVRSIIDSAEHQLEQLDEQVKQHKIEHLKKNIGSN